ncbi:MAG: hypothetical protein AAF552_07390 [Pseudomonadota bacterium]
MRNISVLMLLLAAAAATGQVSNSEFRLEGAGFVTTAGEAASAEFVVSIVGGDGQPVGAASNSEFSAESGPGLLDLPTDRVFDSSFE